MAIFVPVSSHWLADQDGWPQPVDKVASDTLSISAADTVADKNVIGIVLTEDFEDATLDLTFQSNNWIRNSAQAQTGTWSWSNSDIGDNQQSDAVVTVPEGATSISFWYMVSSESGWDYFRFLIDGVQQFQAAGTVAWTQTTHAVTAGQALTFRYFKDVSGSNGADTAYVDNIVFTGVVQPPATPKSGTDILSISLTENAVRLQGLEELLAPDAILVQTNITGVVGSIDESPDSPDGVWLDGTGAVTLRVSFPTPSSDLVSGFSQEFRIRVRPGS